MVRSSPLRLLLAAATAATAIAAGTVGLAPAPALAACTPTDLFAHHTVLPSDAAGGSVVAGAKFGAAVVTGDFDGDGHDDVAVGAPDDSVDGVATGSVSVFPGGTGGVAAGVRLTETSAGAGNETGDRFGAALAAGDFDGDGVDDLAVGIPGEAVGSNTGAGAIAVFPGSAAGLSAGTWLTQTLGSGADEAGDAFGTALAAGDIDGDGYADLAVGTPGEAPSGGSVHGGGVYVYKGSPSGVIRGWFSQQEDAAGTTESGDQFGAAVAVGNVTGDGHADLVVGAPGEGPSGDPAGSGTIYVVPGTATGEGTGFSRTQDGAGGADEGGDHMGSALALGDFDHDGFADVAVGVPGEAPSTAPAGGAVVLFPGASSQLATGYYLDGNDAGEVLADGDRFGASLAAGDVDGDGFADLLVGAPGKFSAAGTAFLFGGRPRDTGSVHSLELGRRIAQADVGFGNEANDAFAAALAFGDVDGDGLADAVVGSSGEAPTGQPASGVAIQVSGLSTGVSLGALVGATTDTTSRLWVRGNHSGTFQVQYRPAGTSTWTSMPETAFGSSTVDYTAVVTLTGLAPDTDYDYRVAVGCLVDHLGQASFRTMPSATATSIRFTYGADIYQPSARLSSSSTSLERQKHFVQFARAAAEDPALMILGGDQIYSDAAGATPSTTADYFRPYRENWGEVNLRSFMQRVPTLMMWDDHEILNNWDNRTAAPYPNASLAFDAYQGGHNPEPFRPGVKYYSLRAGPADFFVTDGRTYRSPNDAPDDSSKTMLGATQLADLESWLSASTAKFKFIVTADPFANADCDLSTPNHDSWCGFRTERTKLFDYVVANGITGVVSIAGDHHYSAAFRGDDTTARIYEFMPNPVGREARAAPATTADMLWHYDSAQEVYGVFDVDTSVSPATLTVRFKGTGGALLRTFVVDENGGITQF